MSIPLFDRGDHAALATQRAQIQADNARLALEDLQQDVGLEVRRAYLDYQAAQEQLEREAQLRAAELALQTSQERYNVGAATLVEVTQARATQVQAASALVTARYNLLFQRTLIDYYVGRPGSGSSSRPTELPRACGLRRAMNSAPTPFGSLAITGSEM